MHEQSPHKSVAYHEAGHVVFGILAGWNLQKVEINLLGGDSGCASWDLPKFEDGILTIPQIEPYCLAYLAGKGSEDFYAPYDAAVYHSYYQDRAEVTKLLDRTGRDDEKDFIVKWETQLRTTLSTRKYEAAIHAVADRLLKDHSLSGEEATRIVREHIPE